VCALDKIKSFLKSLCTKSTIQELLIIAGTAMVGKGLYMIYPPSMWIIVGGFAIYLGLPGKRQVK